MHSLFAFHQCHNIFHFNNQVDLNPVEQNALLSVQKVMLGHEVSGPIASLTKMLCFM